MDTFYAVLTMQKITKFHRKFGVKVLWKHTVFKKFQVIYPKLCGNCVFPKIFVARKLDEITVFYAVANGIDFTAYDQTLV